MERNALESGMSDFRFLSEKRMNPIHYVNSDAEFKCFIHNSDSDMTTTCRFYNALYLSEKYDLLREFSMFCMFITKIF